MESLEELRAALFFEDMERAISESGTYVKVTESCKENHFFKENHYILELDGKYYIYIMLPEVEYLKVSRHFIIEREPPPKIREVLEGYGCRKIQFKKWEDWVLPWLRKPPKEPPVAS